MLACLAFNFVNSVEIVFRRPDLSLVGAIADDNGAPVDGVLDFLEFWRDDVQFVVHFLEFFFHERQFFGITSRDKGESDAGQGAEHAKEWG